MIDFSSKISIYYCRLTLKSFAIYEAIRLHKESRAKKYFVSTLKVLFILSTIVVDRLTIINNIFNF